MSRITPNSQLQHSVLRCQLRRHLECVVHMFQNMWRRHADSIILGDDLCIMWRHSMSFFAADSVLQHSVLRCQLRRHLECVVHMFQNMWRRHTDTIILCHHLSFVRRSCVPVLTAKSILQHAMLCRRLSGQLGCVVELLRDMRRRHTDSLLYRNDCAGV
jgi:hypothetical protein